MGKSHLTIGGIVTGSTSGVLYVHSSPRALCPHVEWAAGRAMNRAVNFSWLDQPALDGSRRTEFTWSGPIGSGAAIASALRGWEHLRFEVTEDATTDSDGGRWMHTPDLGVFYAQTDVTGNMVVPEDRIRYAMEIAGSNALELHRELRLALGQAWDDELEPFRHAAEGNPVVWLHRVG
ncbi:MULTISPECIES: DUF3145 domain-containing protein [Curtobacterium]|uniref:DUF3145 domain-containing protein n=1 Tax=Curtobacterium TaxID=2034 RepID=UPI000DA82F26|nr:MULTISPECIES: DUF3145 domain-containing protein [Curtobacterium]MBY0177585.1 DUF3145 domain-containing protein [Curtobacterium herbarum]MDN3478052.1 DUF3145 domain-containing protein [Curtobacterium sp. APC 4022]MDN4646913.1 DUF3145 domain-containing protein [Curtobacterium sp. PsM8]MDY1006418.1 DUF3145 domain-containing protein [Curtobacterium sp. CFBP9011]PZF67664.1 DUF3145 domain-containing protein [Curtobacterium sp. MCPF17_047]